MLNPLFSPLYGYPYQILINQSSQIKLRTKMSNFLASDSAYTTLIG